MSEQSEEIRRAREEIAQLEAARHRLSAAVMRGDFKARNKDRQLMRRLRDLSRWIMRDEQEEEDEQRGNTERRGEELREAWRQHHPQGGSERDRPKKGRAS